MIDSFNADSLYHLLSKCNRELTHASIVFDNEIRMYQFIDEIKKNMPRINVDYNSEGENVLWFDNCSTICVSMIGETARVSEYTLVDFSHDEIISEEDKVFDEYMKEFKVVQKEHEELFDVNKEVSDMQ